jgi:hypothetical protein
VSWYDRALDSVPRIGEILVALLAAIGLAQLLRGLYSRTLGRRRDRYARLQRLGTNAQLPFFTSVLGEPPAMERTFVGLVTRYDDAGAPSKVSMAFKESVWIDRDFFVHALSDLDQTVHAYSVTTRSKRFRPKIQPPGGTAADPNWLWRKLGKEYRFKPDPAVTLGRTRFADLGRPAQASGWLAPHNWHYFEPYYFGNPGLYQHFVYSVNDAGAWYAPFPSSWIGGFSWGFASSEDEPVDPKLALTKAIKEADAREAAGQMPPQPDPTAADVDFEDSEFGFEEVEDPPLPPELQTFRRVARINTYTVVGPEFALDDYPLPEDRPNLAAATFGVTSFRVRTLG